MQPLNLDDKQSVFEWLKKINDEGNSAIYSLNGREDKLIEIVNEYMENLPNIEYSEAIVQELPLPLFQQTNKQKTYKIWHLLIKNKYDEAIFDFEQHRIRFLKKDSI